MQTSEIKCGCGQVNHLVLIDGRWFYDKTKHGSEAASDNRCFNCRQPLKGLSAAVEKTEPAKTKKEPVKEPDKVKPETVKADKKTAIKAKSKKKKPKK